ncbi:HNH endonuclease [Lysinibacillus sp. NPDC095746]|uniref:HNH endonuclease n=1 Tax=Lysinibacillus sp. NPDC095746 TaxID=3364134 RepID=UPI0038069D9D
MIQLIKLNEPDVLSQNNTEWRKQYLSYFNYDGVNYTKKEGVKIPESLVKKYNSDDIKEQLLIETNKKCAYCESKMTHITYSDIEHIKPKAHRPDLIFEWGNLTVACEKCNRTNKNDYYDELAPLVDPFNDNPETCLYAFGSIIRHKDGDKKGFRTHKVIGLNRPDLFERRNERIEKVSVMIDQWRDENNHGHKQILYKEILKEMEPDKEFSLIVKYLLLAEKII